MIHYHGTPCGGKREEVARFLNGRHALIPWGRDEDIGTAAEVCQSFVIDNSAFTSWRSGNPIKDWRPYMEFIKHWFRHPSFDWCLIPDEIEGDELANDLLIAKFFRWDGWKGGESWWIQSKAVPVWHLHESLERLVKLSKAWPRVALGSSGEWPNPGTERWWDRMRQAMGVLCDEDYRPRCHLHGLRMLDPAIFSRLPLASADSTNAVQNSSNYSRFGMYVPPNTGTRMHIIANRIEAHQSCAIWRPLEEQSVFAFHEVAS